MKRRFSAAVDHGQQPFCQVGVKRIIVTSYPEEIIQGNMCGTSELS
jgi:hypothetical protein